jgi:Fe-coproporphyrin III synthase
MFNRILTSLTHKIHSLPVLVLMPHSRCNCRCVMCDIWKANAEKKELSVEEIQKHTNLFQKLRVKHVALSGGEALMHSNLWALCKSLKSIGVKISLLSTGVTLKNYAQHVVEHCDDVVVSLDGSPALHNQIRDIPNAFEKLTESVKKIKELDSRFRITGRSVIQKLNFRDFEGILKTAYELGLNEISFLPADVSSTAFNRTEPWPTERKEQVGLDLNEVEELERIIVMSFQKYEELYSSHFIVESPEKMLNIPRYYKALLGHGKFPVQKCNAPWVSAVIESNGDVMPCFFHKSYGNIHQNDFADIINSPSAIQFRKELKVQQNDTCKKCVCSLYLPPTKFL